MGAIVGAISFFTSPIGKWISVGLLIVMAYGVGDLRGRRIEYEKAEAAARAAQKAADDQDLQAAKDANSDAARVMDQLKKQRETADASIAALQNQIATMSAPTGAKCLYGDSDTPASEPVARGVRSHAGARAGDTKHPGAARVLAPGAKAPKSQGK